MEISKTHSDAPLVKNPDIELIDVVNYMEDLSIRKYIKGK